MSAQPEHEGRSTVVKGVYRHPEGGVYRVDGSRLDATGYEETGAVRGKFVDYTQFYKGDHEPGQPWGREAGNFQTVFTRVEPREGEFILLTRLLQIEDIGQIIPILETWIRDSETGELLPEEILNLLRAMSESARGEGDRTYLVAESAFDGIVGVIGLRQPEERMLPFTVSENPAELINAYVSKEHRGGKGVGSALVATLEQEARQRGCARRSSFK